MKRKNLLALITIILLLGGCTKIPMPQERHQTLDTIASYHHLQSKVIPTTHFSLYSISNTSECENKSLKVYIEGDGLAWVTRSRLSDDPTPIIPLAAQLMSLDPSHCKIYLARPCQYVGTSECASEYWNTRRFSLEVVETYKEALNKIKYETKASCFSLIGYSGGGAIAALIAAQRNDITKLITVAGNLDTEEWVKYHQLSPLEGSLNPANYAKDISGISQHHYIGGQDNMIPQTMYEKYKKHVDDTSHIKSIICEECTHSKGWVEKWGEYLKQMQ